MKRYHLFEFGDQSWLPDIFRKTLSDILEFQTSIIYRFALPKLMRKIYQNKTDTILDLCSGSGGPWKSLFPILRNQSNEAISILLSDKFPIKNKQNETPFLEYSTESIDALDVSKDLHGFRTMFTAFHHFRPNEAKQILENAANSNCPIAIFEFTERKKERIQFIIKNCLSIYKIFPYISELTLRQKFWIYVIPIVPFIYFWDGLVSHLRSYTMDELSAMTKFLQNENYQWEVGQIDIPDMPNKITYVFGQPN